MFHGSKFGVAERCNERCERHTVKTISRPNDETPVFDCASELSYDQLMKSALGGVSGQYRYDRGHGLLSVCGNVLEAQAPTPTIIAFLINDVTPTWGGVARKAATFAPAAQRAFRNLVLADDRNLRLGKVLSYRLMNAYISLR